MLFDSFMWFDISDLTTSLVHQKDQSFKALKPVFNSKQCHGDKLKRLLLKF